VLARHDSPAEIWITETGYSTWNDELVQVLSFADALTAPVERLYWFCAEDLAESRNTMDGFHNDEREYHLGLRRENGDPKVLARVWAEGGLAGVAAAARAGGADSDASWRPFADRADAVAA